MYSALSHFVHLLGHSNLFPIFSFPLGHSALIFGPLGALNPQELQLLADGLGVLFFKTVRGVQRQFRAKTKAVLRCLLRVPRRASFEQPNGASFAVGNLSVRNLFAC